MAWQARRHGVIAGRANANSGMAGMDVESRHVLVWRVDLRQGGAGMVWKGLVSTVEARHVESS